MAATAPDGIVEAIEMSGHRFVIGVQWHPEMLLKGSDGMLSLFREFVEEGKIR